jgi:hypothetical protein
MVVLNEPHHDGFLTLTPYNKGGEPQGPCVRAVRYGLFYIETTYQRGRITRAMWKDHYGIFDTTDTTAIKGGRVTREAIGS